MSEEKIAESNERVPTVKQTIPTSKHYGNKLIQVTQDDIDKSCRADAGACMNARAIKRQIPEAKSIHVDIATTRWTDKYTGIRYTFLTPGPAQKAIIPYDMGLKMPPYSFYLKQLIQITPKSVIARRPPRLAIDSHKGTDKKHRDHPTVLVGGKAMPEAGPRKGFVRRFGLRELSPNLKQAQEPPLGMESSRDTPIFGEEPK